VYCCPGHTHTQHQQVQGFEPQPQCNELYPITALPLDSAMAYAAKRYARAECKDVRKSPSKMFFMMRSVGQVAEGGKAQTSQLREPHMSTQHRT